MDGRYRPYPAYKPSGVDWLGEIPSHWNARRLKFVARFAYGDSLSAINREEGSVPVFGSNGIVGMHNRANTSAPCIVIGRKGSSGKVNYSDVPVFAIDTTFYVDQKCTKQDLRWLFYVLGLLGLDESSQDSAVPGLSRDFAYNQTVPFPDLAEQRAIAEHLDRETARIDALIARKRELLDLLERQRAAIISHAVTKGLNPAAPLKYSGIPWLGEIPSHWEVSRLKWFVRKIGSGKTPRGGADNYVSDGVLFIRSQNVHFTGLRLDDVVYITEKTNQEMASSQVKGNDVLLNITGASLGRCSLVPEDFPPGNVNQHVCIIRTRAEKLLPTFMYYSLMSDPMQAQIFASEDGISREGLNFQSIGNMVIALPPSIVEQSQLCAFLEYETARIDKLIEEIAGSIGLLQRYRTALISAAVTGKMDVRGM